MRKLANPVALVAALIALACAGGGAASRKDVDDLRGEVRGLRAQNEELVRRVDALTGRMELVTARLTRAAPPRAAPAAPAAEALPPLVPPDLAVVKVAPPGRPRTPPPISTAVPIAEPDPARLDALAQPRGRELTAEADAELSAARRATGLDQAHALEDFSTHYPRHPQADNALVESASAYAAAGKDEAACKVARRAAEDYPAGDAMSDLLERLAWCEARRGATDGERRLLARLVSEYPRSAAAERAGKRLTQLNGRAADVPAASPPRSGP